MSERRTASTLQDIAQALGVSRTTVSNAFNRPDQLSPDLRDRILEAARDLGYPGPHPAARMLRTGRAGAIGLIFPEALPYAFHDPAAVAMLSGVAQACEDAGSNLLLLPSLGRVAEQNPLLEAVVDGFLVYSIAQHSEILERVRQRRLPLVCIDQPSLPGVGYVGIDDRAACRRIAAHVAGLGHRRFAVIGFRLQDDGYEGAAPPERRRAADYTVTGARLAGYLDALAEAGIDPDSVPMEECRLNSEDSGFHAARALLARDPRPTAILAMSDRFAIGALRAAVALGLKVPDDLSVTGFDDIPAAATVRPGLTTIRQPTRDKGLIAAQRLLEGAESTDTVLLPAELVVRGSTGPAGA
ncbi:MAG TPA: LacI family DNA-binding transcriptional regulator [Alphaproteobacteria bacterium]|nr:LacI family DNA-binding transcriptional regulator [Alphaproteobacteria bacterium]